MDRLSTGASAVRWAETSALAVPFSSTVISTVIFSAFTAAAEALSVKARMQALTISSRNSRFMAVSPFIKY